MNHDFSQEQLNAMRHTAAHVLAAASVRLKPETRLGVGPAIDDGFYQDIDVDENWTGEDLQALQKEMEKIRDQDLPITQYEMSKDEARELYRHDPYKTELIDELPGDKVGISDMGNGFFLNLCRGGHVASTKDIGHFKLTRLAGVYWRGDSSKPQLQRIYGVLFPTDRELKEHLKNLDEAIKRDHRKLGKLLDLFTFSPLVGAGLPLFTPRGTMIREQLVQFIRSLQEPRGYQLVSIPHLAKQELYKTSGHWEKFHNDLFHVKGAHDEFVLKPMNCPHHTQIYASRKRSYRELPLRFAEVTTVYRDEQAGELAGLTRVRSITQDDAHVFCRPDQIQSEIEAILDIAEEFYAKFNLALTFRLSLWDSTHPERYLGTTETWEHSQDILRQALRSQARSFTEAAGEAAFYGPKIDFMALDSLRRTWQMATVQLDFNMPKRFALTYSAHDGSEQTPVMIHRAISGALERFIAILLEHYAGALPLWLSPVQVSLLPITDHQMGYTQEIAVCIRDAGIRTEIDSRSETIGKKIHDAQTQKVPLMLIIGKKESETKTVSVRSRDKGDAGTHTLLAFIKETQEDIWAKT